MPFYTSLINIDDVLNEFSLFRSKYVKKNLNVPAKYNLCLGMRAQVPTISGGLKLARLVFSLIILLIYVFICIVERSQLFSFDLYMNLSDELYWLTIELDRTISNISLEIKTFEAKLQSK